MAGFRQLARAAVRGYRGTKQDLARQVGIDPPVLSRYLNGQTVPDVNRCLLLARATGTDPNALLRAAQHGEVVGSIEALYGPAAGTRRITSDEAALLAAWRTLAKTHQRAFRVLIAALASRPGRRAPSKTSRAT